MLYTSYSQVLSLEKIENIVLAMGEFSQDSRLKEFFESLPIPLVDVMMPCLVLIGYDPVTKVLLHYYYPATSSFEAVKTNYIIEDP